MAKSQAKVKVKRNAKGIWYASAYLGRDEHTGIVRRPQRQFPEAKTKEDAERLADKWLETIDGNTLVDALNTYIDTIEANGQSANTVRMYRSFVKNHIQRLLPYAIPQELKPAQLTEFEIELGKGNSEHKAMSPATIRTIHWFLCGGFKFMRDTLGIVSISPMNDVIHPGSPDKTAIALDEADFTKLRNWLVGQLKEDQEPEDRAFVFAVWLGLNTGMRAGEICGLRRRDFSHYRRLLNVNGTAIETNGLHRQDKTKTKASHRNVSITKEQADVISDMLSWQDERIEGLTADSPLVTADGGLIRPSSLTKRFSTLAAYLTFPKGTTFHTLRHTHATFLILAGADIKTVQERLGHGSTTTTLEYYGHVLPGRDAAAAEAFEMLAKEV